jgi:hypothetical protein
MSYTDVLCTTLLFHVLDFKALFIPKQGQTTKKFHQQTGRSHGHVPEDLQECACEPFLTTYLLLSHFNYKTQKSQTLMTLNQQDEEISKWNTILISYAAQVQEQ